MNKNCKGLKNFQCQAWCQCQNLPLLTESAALNKIKKQKQSLKTVGMEINSCLKVFLEHKKLFHLLIKMSNIKKIYYQNHTPDDGG